MEKGWRFIKKNGAWNRDYIKTGPVEEPPKMLSPKIKLQNS